MSYQHILLPSAGQKITVNADFSLDVPDQPIIPFIEGDGIGVDITPVMIKVVDAAVATKKFTGWRFMLVKNQHASTVLMFGCLTKP